MRILKSISGTKICQLCTSRPRLVSYLSFDKYRWFLKNSVNVWGILLYKRHSTNAFQDVIREHENVVTQFVTDLMKCHINNEDFRKISSFSFNPKNYREISRMLSSRSTVFENLKLLEELNSGGSKDKELQSLVEEEKKEYRQQLRLLDFEIILSLLPEEPHDDINDLVMEIKHGIGGQEAMLFAKDLFDMYCKYITYKGWTYEIAELSVSEIGGLRSSSLLVYGKNAFKQLYFEGGVHRVQRVPSTEKGGRMHTSTVGVAILPQPSEVQVVINDKDLKIETKKASGAGGQHVNTTDSAVRITHIPSGTVVECQEDRSQQKNRKIAMERLRASIYDVQIKEQLAKIKNKRKLQFGTSGRSEKIRTYNFNQDRITDHRIGLTLHNVDSFLNGSELLDKLLSTLQEESNLERLTDFISSLKAN